MALGLQIPLIYSILCFLKDFEILNLKVVPNDNFKFGAERVKWTTSEIADIQVLLIIIMM